MRLLSFRLALMVCLAAPAARAQTPTAVPATADPGPSFGAPDTLYLDGVPPVPKALAERVARYMEARGATLVDWHPVRRELLISTRFSNVPQLHVVKFPGGDRRQITFFQEPVTTASWRPVTGDGIVFQRDAGGSEFFQLFWRPADGGETRMFTDGKSRNGGVCWSNGGKMLAYTSTRRNGKDDDIYIVDPGDPKSERLLLQVEGGGWSVEDWSPDDRTLLLREYLSVNESRLWTVDLESGKRKRLSPETKEPSAWGPAAFHRDGSARVLAVTDVGGEFKRRVTLDLVPRPDDGRHHLVFDADYDVAAIALSRDGRWLAYVMNERGCEVLHLEDLKTGEVPLPPLPAGTIGRIAFHENSRDLAFNLTSARSTSDVYSIDVTKLGPDAKYERWTESETGDLDTSALSEPEPISWKSFDGREITGFIYRPPAKFTGPRPVMIHLHGGPESQFQPGFLGRMNYFLNELGVALIMPNVRGSSGLGKTFVALDNGKLREDSVKDIGALLDWIAARPDLDKDRVMVRGGSYGGYMSLACMEHYADRLRCGVDDCGIANFVSFLERTESYRRDLRRVEYGDERDLDMRAFLTKISPVGNIEKMKKPMFIVQGRNDPRVPYTEAEQIVAGLKKQGVPVWYMLASDEGHGYQKKKNADYLFLVTIEFVRKYLLGE